MAANGFMHGIELAARHGMAIRLRVEAGGDTLREQPHRRIDHDVEDNSLLTSRFRSCFLSRADGELKARTGS